MWAGLLSFPLCLSLLADFSLHKTHIFSPGVEEWRADVGRDWGQEKKGMIEDETAGWHHRLDGHEFE